MDEKKGMEVVCTDVTYGQEAEAVKGAVVDDDRQIWFHVKKKDSQNWNHMTLTLYVVNEKNLKFNHDLNLNNIKAAASQLISKVKPHVPHRLEEENNNG